MSQQPTLLDVPGILFRTILRTIARIVFALAGILLLLGLGCTFISLFLVTWRTPRTHRIQIGANLTVALIELVKSYK